MCSSSGGGVLTQTHTNACYTLGMSENLLTSRFVKQKKFFFIVNHGRSECPLIFFGGFVYLFINKN